ncbi:uncharacterized protein LOC141677225 [Apium graveolens]|uniref:uncharacterized protein LOC141677225 n=1 Tax=Apium graveolens TaxID=4045 RepID=UPI003D7BB143
MSRCFPFPPPGYEKKLIPEVANVLKKEKTKEKKHKEKKDKEKKEGKEKREKEKSNGKHREKKDKKEKHKDRKKDKEKNKEKDQEKGSTLVEKKVSGQGEDYIRGKFHQSGNVQDDDKKEHGNTSEEKRQIGQFGYCNGEKLHQKVERSREKKNPADEKKLAVQLEGHSGGNKTVLHTFADKDSQDSKFMVEFNKRINDEGKGSGSQMVERFMDTGFKKLERIDKFAVRDNCTVVEGKEKVKDKPAENRKIDGQRIHHEEIFNGNTMFQNLSGSIQNNTGVSKSKDISEGTMEGKEKSKEKSDDKRGEKRKSKHKDKQSQGKDKNNKKEKRKEDKAKKDHQKSEKDNSKSSNKNGVGTPSNKTSHFSEGSDKNAATEGILKKRKDTEKNGFLPEYVIKPEKMPRLDSHPLSENGQESEPFETTTLFTSKEQGTPSNFEVDKKDKKINGLTGPHPLPTSLAPKPPPVISEQIAEASRIPPHPDMKYLSKVFSVPQIDEWSEVDDQAWLFNNKDSLLNKSEVDPVGVNQGQQVWAETLRIESADVFALPYVIPY